MSDTLWTVCGTQPVAWQIPLWGVPKGDDIELMAAVPLLNNQKLALHERITSNYGFHAIGLYRINLHCLKAIARAQPSGTQPEDLLVWGPQRQAHRTPERMERNEFLDSLSMTGIGTRAQCEFWFKSICNHALHWLINEDRTVDLYFARLHPTHLSRDWFRRLNGNDKWTQKAPKFDESRLVHGNPIRLKRGQAIRRIELEPTHIWRSLADKIEKQRLKVLKQYRYAALVERLLLSQIPFWTRHYAAHRNDHLAVSSGIMERHPSGVKKLFQRGRPTSSRAKRSTMGVKSWQGRKERDTLRRLRKTVQERTILLEQLVQFVAFRKEIFGHFRTIPEAIAILREMPNVRSALSNLRNAGGIVGEPRDETERALRLLVSCSSGKLVREKLLVKQLQRRESRLAASVEQSS